MVVHIELEDLEDLDIICWCVEFAMKEDKIHPDNREKVRKLLEKLRGDYEEFSDLDRNRD